MKNTSKVIRKMAGLVVMAAIGFAALSMTGCPSPDEGGNNNHHPAGVPTDNQTPREVPPDNQTPTEAPTNKQTPVAGDFTINGTGTFTYNGSPRLVTVMPKSGKSTGAITVKYNGNTVAPSAAGAYTVTFDVKEAEGFNAASGLSAGTLTIKAASGGGGGSGGGSGGGNGGSGGSVGSGGATPQAPDPQSFNLVFSGPTEKVIPVTKIITNNLSKSNGGAITLGISDSFTGYEWYVGGSKVDTGKNVTLQADDPAFIPGDNWITAVVYDGTGADATPWSGTFVVVVSN